MDQPKNKPSSQGLGAKPQDLSLFNVRGGIKQIKEDPTAAAQSFGASVAEETLPTVAGWGGMGAGAKLGATAGSIFGPAGTAVGGFIGGVIGFSIPSIITKFTQDAVLKNFVPDTFKKLEETKLNSPYAARVGGVVPLFGTGGVATFSKDAAIKAASRILPGEALKKMTEEQIVSQGRNILAKSMAARAGVGAGISGVGTAYDVATGKPVTPKEALSQAGESAGVLALTGEPTRLGRAITSTTNRVLNKAFIPFADRYINRSWELELHRTAVNNASNAIKQVEQQQASIIKQGTPTQEGIQSYRALEEAKNQLKLRLRTTQSMAYRSYEEMNVLQRKLSDAGFDLPNYYSQLSEAQKKGTLAKVINDYRNKWKLQPETIIGEPLKPSEPAVTPKGTLGITEQPVKEWKDILSEFKTDLGKDLGASTYTGSLLGGGEWKSLAKLISNSNLKIKDQIKEYRNTLSKEGEDSSFLSDEQIGEVLETAKNEPLEPTFELVGEGRKKRIPNQSEFYEQNKYYLENLVKSKGITLLSNAPTVSKPTTFTGEKRVIGSRSEDLKDLISSEYEKAKENFAKPKGPQTLTSMLNQADLMGAKPARPEPPKTVEEQRALEAKQAGYFDEVSPEKEEMKEIKEKLEGPNKKKMPSLLEQLRAAQTKNEVKKEHPKFFNQSTAYKETLDWLRKKDVDDYTTPDEYEKAFLEYVEKRYRVELSALAGKRSEFGQKLPSSSIKKMVNRIAEAAKKTIRHRGLSSIEPAIEQKPSEFKIDWEGTRKDEAERLAAERAETRGAAMFPRVTSGIKGRPELEPIYKAQREAQQKWVAEIKRKRLEKIARPVVTERLQTQKMEETKSGEAQVSQLDIDKKIRNMTDEELNEAIGLLKNEPSARVSPLTQYAEIVNAGTPRARAVIKPQISTKKGEVKELPPIKKIDRESKIFKARLADLKKAEAKATKIAITKAKNLVALIRSYVDKGMTNAEIKEMYAGQIRATVINAIINDPKKYINQIRSGEPVTTKKSVNKVKVSEDKLEAIKAEQVKQKPTTVPSNVATPAKPIVSKSQETPAGEAPQELGAKKHLSSLLKSDRKKDFSKVMYYDVDNGSVVTTDGFTMLVSPMELTGKNRSLILYDIPERGYKAGDIVESSEQPFPNYKKVIDGVKVNKSLSVNLQDALDLSSKVKKLNKALGYETNVIEVNGEKINPKYFEALINGLKSSGAKKLAIKTGDSPIVLIEGDNGSRGYVTKLDPNFVSNYIEYFPESLKQEVIKGSKVYKLEGTSTLVSEVPAKTPSVKTKDAIKATTVKKPVKKESITPVKPPVVQKSTKAAKVAEPPLKAKIDAIKKEQVRQSKKKPTEVAPSAVEPTDIEPISGPLPPSSPKAIKQKKDVNKVADKALKTTKVVEPIKSTIKPTKVKKTKPILPEKVIKKVVKKVNKISNQADIDRIKSNNSPEKNNEKIAKINAAKRKKSNSLQIKTNKLIKDQEDKLFEIEMKTNPTLIDCMNAIAEWKESGKAHRSIYSNLDATRIDFENLVDVPNEEERNLERIRFGKDTNDRIGLGAKVLQKVYSMVEGFGNTVADPMSTFVNVYHVLKHSGIANWKMIDAAGRTIPNSASQAVTEFLTTGIGIFDPKTMTFKQSLETPFTRVLLEGLEKSGKANEDNYVVFVNLYKEWQFRMQEIEEEMLLVEQMKEVQEEVRKLNEYAKTLTDRDKKNALIKEGNDKLEEIVFPVRLGRKTPPGAVKQFIFRFTANQVSDDPKVGIPSVFQMGEKILGIPADEIKRIFDSANESERKQNIEVLKFARESGVISNDLAKIFMEKVYYNPFTIIHENLLGDGNGITAYVDGLFSQGGSYVDQDAKEVLTPKTGAEKFDIRDLLGRGDDGLYAKIANWKSIIDMSKINLYRSLGVREASLTPTSELDYMILQNVGVDPEILKAAKFLAFPTTNTDKTQSTLVYINGKKTYWGLANRRLLNAFNTKLVTPDSRILNAAKSAKNLFTMSITVFPGFRISASLQERFAAAAMLGEANVKGALPKHTKGVIKNVISGFFAPNKLSEEQLKKLSDAMINGGVFGNIGDIFRQTSDRSSFFKKNEAAEEKLIRADVKRILERNIYLQDIKMSRMNVFRAMTKQIWNGLTNLEHSGRIQDIAVFKQNEDFIIEQEKLALEKNLIVNELEKLRSELSLQNETIKENYESLKGANKVDRKIINESIDVSKNAAKELKKLITDLEIKLSILNPKIYGHNIVPYSEGRVLSADFSQLTGSKFLNGIRSTIPFVGTVTTGLFNFLSRVFRAIKPEFMRKIKEQKRVNLFEERMEDLNKNIKNIEVEVRSKESLVSNLDTEVKNTKEKMKKIDGEIKGRLREIKEIDKLMTKGNKVGRKFIPVSRAQRSRLGDRRVKLIKQTDALITSFKELGKSLAREISDSLVNKLSKANSDYKQSLRKLESLKNFKEDFQQQEESNKKSFEYEKAIKNNIGKYLYWFLASHITVNYLTDLLYELAGDEAKLRYDNYYEYQKYHYIYIPGTKSDYKIPGGFVLQPFARWFVNSTYTIADDLWAKIDKDHVIDSASRKNLVAELVHALFSTNEGDGVTFAITFAQAAEEAFELLRNSGMAKSPNTGQYYIPEHLRGIKPSLQYDSTTGALFKFFATSLAKIGIEQSPMGWEKFYRDFTNKFYAGVLHPLNTIIADVPNITAPYAEGGRIEAALNETADKLITYAFVSKHSVEENRYFGKVVGQYNDDRDKVNLLERNTLESLIKSGYQVSQDKKDYDIMARELANDEEAFKTILITNTNIKYQETLSSYNKWYINKRNDILLYYPQDTREQGLKKSKQLAKLDAFIGKKKLELVQNYKERKNLLLNPNFSSKFTKNDKIEIADIYLQYVVARGLRKEIGVKQ